MQTAIHRAILLGAAYPQPAVRRPLLCFVFIYGVPCLMPHSSRCTWRMCRNLIALHRWVIATAAVVIAFEVITTTGGYR